MSKLINSSSFISRAALVFLCLSTLTNCSQETDNNKAELILGRWEIQEAFRNGQTTESLDELYFEFFKDGKMRTNLMGTPETAVYELDEGQLYQRESQMDIDYNIQTLSDSIMIMTTQLRDYNFRFQLRRSVQEE